MFTEKNILTGEIQKSQLVRLVDVFIIAPYLIHLSQNKKLDKTNKNILIGLGLSTLIYNGANYLKNK
jgi:hypothetical protein